MGTSAAGEAAERLAKLQARKKELEGLLAAKNEELYRLCVREVQLTGVVPPEAPPSPAGRRSAPKPPEPEPRRPLTHRLSTPACPDFTPASHILPEPPPPASMAPALPISLPVQLVQPALAPVSIPTSITAPSYVRYHSVTSERMNKLHYTADRPETRNLSRVHETHFSSSHPDIATHYSNMFMSKDPNIHMNSENTPLIYQFATQLRARSPHLSGLPHVMPNTSRKRESSRRNTLQRTQTYHLTSHSDYNRHDDISVNPHVPLSVNVRKNPIMEPQKAQSSRRRQYEQYPSPSNSNYQVPTLATMPPNISRSQQMSYATSTSSIYTDRMPDHEQRVKEKEWYETSLDSPSNANCAINLSSESCTPIMQHSPGISRTRSVQDSLNSNVSTVDYSPIALNANNYSPVASNANNYSPIAVNANNYSPGASNSQPVSPRSQQPVPAVPFESPQNCTVVESGKWIPYREETKPFEMSDFYKYSTKFRQQTVQKQKVVYDQHRPDDAQPYSQDNWHHYS